MKGRGSVGVGLGLGHVFRIQDAFELMLNVKGLEVQGFRE